LGFSLSTWGTTSKAVVADKILNHQAGTISGVAAVYQRHDFLAERKEALNRWGAHVAQIVEALSTKKNERHAIDRAEKVDAAGDCRDPIPSTA
jgi:hypothetical protein